MALTFIIQFSRLLEIEMVLIKDVLLSFSPPDAELNFEVELLSYFSGKSGS